VQGWEWSDGRTQKCCMKRLVKPRRVVWAATV
jgi:hypothetical protein